MFDNAAYLISAAELHQLPPDSGAEVAFAGRSNAGKSSAINAICARRKLAFVSRTPGRTQMINFFSISNGTRLVDLPGYGYAKAPAAVRDKWEALIAGYLKVRRSLRGLVIIMDARHPLTALDNQMLEWFSGACKPVEVLLTKADKLSRQVAQRQLVQTRAVLAQTYPTARVQLFSSVTGEGVEEARHALQHLVGHSDRSNGLPTTPDASALELRRPKENPRQRG